VPEVIDAWFDSGSMPFAQWGYPQRGRAEFEASFPPTSSPRRSTRRAAGSTRCSGSRRCCSRIAPKPHPYKTCIVLGHVADRYGKKESKSKGNYTPPEVILDRVRLEFAAVAPEAGELAQGTPAIAREDYEGLDLTGESRRCASTAATAPNARSR
jgi:isoleucyl-tRNA synthetase